MLDLVFLVTLLLAIRSAIGLNATQWRSQSVYQLLTDRFALSTDNYQATCNNLANYCGGTFQGIINHLDYIQNMGFTAIWISPVVGQLNQSTPDGQAYHGYWAQDIYRINPSFGTAADLKNLSQALHNRNMYLMVDVVTNHMAYYGCPTCVDYSVFNPFNSQSYFHPNCTITYDTPKNLTSIQQCWEVNYPGTETLPDLRTESNPVQSAFNAWVTQFISNYSIDGMRIDSVQQVNPSFWPSFSTSAGGTYMVGEVFDGNASYACSYQASGMDGILNYPTYFTILSAFNSSAAPGVMSALSAMVQQVKSSCYDSTLLGSFIENHDNNRFAYNRNDLSLIKNAIAFTLLADGIPILYYGQEQGFNGSTVPSNREILWPSQYNRSSPLYIFVSQVNALRKHAINIDSTYLTYKAYPVSYTSNTILMRKGINNAVIGLYTNLGANGATTPFSIPMSSTGYSANQSIIEVISCTAFTTDSSGTLTGQVTTGLPQVFYPASALTNSGICAALTNICTVLFDEIATTYVGQTIKIAGSVAQLGNWNTTNAVSLSAANYTTSSHLWFGTVTFVAGTVFQYKAINVSSSGNVVYEGGSNHVFTVPTGCTTTVTASAAWQT